MNFQDITSQFSTKDQTIQERLINTEPPYAFRNIFSDTIYKQGNINTSKNPVSEILNYKSRAFLDKNIIPDLTNFKQSNVKVFSWNDYPSENAKLPRYFMIWVSPQLILQISEGQKEIPIHIYLHPYGEIGEKEKEYFINGKISDYYRDVGIRYMINQHFIIHHNRYAVNNDNLLDKPLFNLPLCVVFPIFSGSAYSSFPVYQVNNYRFHFIEIIENLINRSIPYFISENSISSDIYSVSKITISAFSRGGSLLKVLFSNPQNNFLKKIREVYTFDIVMNRELTKEERKPLEGEKEEDTKRRIGAIILKEKTLAINQFWKNIKIWQGEDRNRKVRIYAAEQLVIQEIFNELKNNLTKYGGGRYQEGQFSLFNGEKIDNKNYSGMSNGYELYSTDNSRILFTLPSNTFNSYIDSSNPGGIYLWEGHSWYAQSFITHALFHG